MTSSAETKADKAARLTAAGYLPARGPGRCCLCRNKIAPGQFIGRMPPSWRPGTKRRHAHHRCVEALKGELRARLEASQ